MSAEEPKGLYLLPEPERLVRRLEAQDFRLLHLATPVADQRGLESALAEALALPSYLGAGYDALFDCLTDRAALGGVPRLLILLDDWRGFAAADPAGWLRFVELVLDAGRFWRAREGDVRLCLRD